MSDLGTPLQVFLRNTISLTLREMRSKFGNQKLSYVWALIEPLGWILMLSMLFMAMGTRTPPVGDSFVIFFATGFVPFSAFRDTGNVVRNAVQANKPLLYFPVIKPMDTFVSRALLESLTQATVLALIVGGHSFIFQTIPDADWLDVFVPFFLLVVMGFNTGIINCVIMAYFSTWAQIWNVVSRPLLLVSGLFYTAESLPQEGQDILYWNPIMHCIEWVRTGFFPGFESNFLDVQYVLIWAFGGLFLALVLERMFRNKILE